MSQRAPQAVCYYGQTVGCWTMILIALCTLFPSQSRGETNVDKAKPIVIAHRGASGYLPEHTEGAKVLAIAQGADFVEQDVVLSRDGVLVVSHDITMNETTDVEQRFPLRARKDGKFYFADFDLCELRSISLRERDLGKSRGENSSIRFPHPLDQRLLTLEDEIRLVQGLMRTLKRPVGIYVELKAPAWHHHEFGSHMGDRLVQVLAKFGYSEPGDPCYIQCFEPTELKYVRDQLHCRLRLIQLVGNQPLGIVPASQGTKDLSREEAIDLLKLEMVEVSKFAYGIGPSIQLLATRNQPSGELASTGLVEAAHSAGLSVHPYTVRLDALPSWAASVDVLHDFLINHLHVDGFFTDFPDRGRAAVDR